MCAYHTLDTYIIRETKLKECQVHADLAYSMQTNPPIAKYA
jgi:hypothetical protein